MNYPELGKYKAGGTKKGEKKPKAKAEEGFKFE